MRSVTASDKFRKGYRYQLSEPVGKNFAPDFKPELSPKQMLALGIFGGTYFLGGGEEEFPESWFSGAKVSRSGEHEDELNFFKVRASQPLSVWQKKGWISESDPRGWVQWYFRYYLGRRLPEEDARQIKRWKAMRRHVVQVTRNCAPGDVHCRPKQRQALLHWAYDSRRL